MTSPVHIRRDGGIHEITLDRPKANAIDVATSRALYSAFAAFEADPQARVAILTGAGTRFFSAGWDLKAAEQGEAVDADHGPGGFAGLTEFHDRRKPVIAAVNGLAVGGGFELALACDIVLASDTAQFFLPEVTLGIVADSGGVLRLPKAVPRALATRMLLTGERLTAAQALQQGLVSEVVAPGDLLPAARALAERICTAAPLAVAATRAILTQTGHLSVEEGYRIMRSGAIPAYQAMLASQDSLEGARAFAEGRDPVWEGR
ncbi:enoyl-CoA hydratase-related protein [Paracoccus sp. (in: a-proteobacteria)]|uniref:enoyl-CoA hydratase-related protein n=1 Tax=Paracoccus sp. TaxID=267 RepID=UPI0032205442